MVVLQWNTFALLCCFGQFMSIIISVIFLLNKWTFLRMRHDLSGMLNLVSPQSMGIRPASTLLIVWLYFVHVLNIRLVNSWRLRRKLEHFISFLAKIFLLSVLLLWRDHLRLCPRKLIWLIEIWSLFIQWLLLNHFRILRSKMCKMDFQANFRF